MSDLLKETKSGWDSVDENLKNEIFKFADEYMYFLNRSKTEREIISTAEGIVRENGFKRRESRIVQPDPGNGSKEKTR